MASHKLSGLAGKRIAQTRPAQQSGTFAQVVQANGGIPIVRPAIEIEEVAPSEIDLIITAGKRYDWVVFTSANAVTVFCSALERCGARSVNLSARIAAVGQATATKIKECLRAPDLVSAGESAESLAREMGDVMHAKILFPRGEQAMADLPRILAARGAMLDCPILYRTIPAKSAAVLAGEWESGLIDAVLFASPSAVRFVRAEMDPDKVSSQAVLQAAIFCLGESTASEARAAGFIVTAVPEKHTQEALLETAAQWFENDKSKKK